MSEIRDILVYTCKKIESIDEFVAKNLKFEEQIYISAGTTWLENSAPLEIQVSDGGENTVDRDGSARRAQLSINIAILLRRPVQVHGQHASILSGINDDIQTYGRALRATLDGDFLSAAPIIGIDATDLLVRPLVYTGSSNIMSRTDYPDLFVKEFKYTGGINDDLS